MLMRAQTNPRLGRQWLAKTAFSEVTDWLRQGLSVRDNQPGALLPTEDIHRLTRKPSSSVLVITSFTVQECGKRGLLPPDSIKIPCSAPRLSGRTLLSCFSLLYFPHLPSGSPLLTPNPSMFLDVSKRCKCNKYTYLHFTEYRSYWKDQNLQCVSVATLHFQLQPWYMQPFLLISIHFSFHMPAFTENVLESDSLGVKLWLYYEWPSSRYSGLVAP